MFLRNTATTNQRGERAKRRDGGFISDRGASSFGQVTSRRYRHGAVHLMISHFYASKMRACSWGVLRGPCEAFITCNWGFVFLTATLLTAFFPPFFSAPLQEWSKSICLTFVHNIWPLGYSAVQLINNATSAHVFPFTTPSKRNTSSRLLLSSPFPQQWVHFSDPVGERTGFSPWTRWNAVKPDLLHRKQASSTTLYQRGLPAHRSDVWVMRAAGLT